MLLRSCPEAQCDADAVLRCAAVNSNVGIG